MYSSCLWQNSQNLYNKKLAMRIITVIMHKKNMHPKSKNHARLTSIVIQRVASCTTRFGPDEEDALKQTSDVIPPWLLPARHVKCTLSVALPTGIRYEPSGCWPDAVIVILSAGLLVVAWIKTCMIPSALRNRGGSSGQKHFFWKNIMAYRKVETNMWVLSFTSPYAY